jgi:4-aminobutyrate aminotransferase-like enzyme
MEEEATLDNVNARSEQFFTGLRALQTELPNVIADVRGLVGSNLSLLSSCLPCLCFSLSP